jgi:hypothetical protein
VKVECSNEGQSVRFSPIASARIPLPPRQSCLNLRQTWIVLFFLPFLLPKTALGVDFTFEIPPVPVAVDIGEQHIAITVSGEVSASPGPPGAGNQTFPMNLRADLGELQSHLTPLVQAELNRAERCGERISIQSATLAPAASAADLTVHLHYEKWICIAAEGNTAKKLLGSDATIHVTLNPVLEKSVAGGQTVRLDARIGNIEADDPLGEMLRSGAVGTAMRDKIREALLKVLQRSTDLEGVMTPQVRRFVAIQKIVFVDAGFGRLALDMAGCLQVPGDSVSTVLEQFGNR